MYLCICLIQKLLNMSTVHSVLEKELGDLRGRILNNLKGLFIVKGATGKFLDLTNVYGMADGVIIGVNSKGVLLDTGDSYDFNELEADILLWLLGQIEEDKFTVAED